MSNFDFSSARVNFNKTAPLDDLCRQVRAALNWSEIQSETLVKFKKDRDLPDTANVDTVAKGTQFELCLHGFAMARCASVLNLAVEFPQECKEGIIEELYRTLLSPSHEVNERKLYVLNFVHEQSLKLKIGTELSVFLKSRLQVLIDGGYLSCLERNVDYLGPFIEMVTPELRGNEKLLAQRVAHIIETLNREDQGFYVGMTNLSLDSSQQSVFLAHEGIRDAARKALFRNMSKSGTAYLDVAAYQAYFPQDKLITSQEFFDVSIQYARGKLQELHFHDKRAIPDIWPAVHLAMFFGNSELGDQFVKEMAEEVGQYALIALAQGYMSDYTAIGIKLARQIFGEVTFPTAQNLCDAFLTGLKLEEYSQLRSFPDKVQGVKIFNRSEISDSSRRELGELIFQRYHQVVLPICENALGVPQEDAAIITLEVDDLVVEHLSHKMADEFLWPAELLSQHLGLPAPELVFPPSVQTSIRQRLEEHRDIASKYSEFCSRVSQSIESDGLFSNKTFVELKVAPKSKLDDSPVEDDYPRRLAELIGPVLRAPHKLRAAPTDRIGISYALLSAEFADAVSPSMNPRNLGDLVHKVNGQ